VRTLLHTCTYCPCQRSCAKRTGYTHICTDHQVSHRRTFSIYRRLRTVTNTEPPRWALQLHVELPVQGSPSLSFLCGGCRHYCHPDDDMINGWVCSNAVLYGGCGGCKWNILYQLSFSECYSLMSAMQCNVTRLLSHECSGTMHGKAMQRDKPEVNRCRWIQQTRSKLPF